jgi:hypothetical protein
VSYHQPRKKAFKANAKTVQEAQDAGNLHALTDATELMRIARPEDAHVEPVRTLVLQCDPWHQVRQARTECRVRARVNREKELADAAALGTYNKLDRGSEDCELARSLVACRRPCARRAQSVPHPQAYRSFRHFRFKFDAREAARSVAAAKSHGNSDIGKVHKLALDTYNTMHQTVPDADVPDVKDRAADPVPAKDRRCRDAGECLCSVGGLRTIAIQERLQYMLKKEFPTKQQRDMLSDGEVTLVCMGCPPRGEDPDEDFIGRPVGRRAACWWVADALLSPFKQLWHSVRLVDEDLETVTRDPDDENLLDLYTCRTFRLQSMLVSQNEFGVSVSLSQELRWSCSFPQHEQGRWDGWRIGAVLV